jgi:hypothetical protein
MREINLAIQVESTLQHLEYVPQINRLDLYAELQKMLLANTRSSQAHAGHVSCE